MNAPLRAALHDLATEAEVPPLDLAGMRSVARRRRRSRRLSVLAGVVAVAVAAPLAWSAVPRGLDEATDQPPAAARSAGGLVSGVVTLFHVSDDDVAEADEALRRCTRQPGTRSLGRSMDSSRLLFAHTAAEHDRFQACLRRVPDVNRTETTLDQAFMPVAQLGTDAVEPGPLRLGLGSLRATPGGWVEHDLSLTNTTSDVLEVEPPVLDEVVDGMVRASSGACGPVRLDPPCTPELGPLQPGQVLTTVVRLDRDLPGLAPLRPRDLQVVWPLVVRGPGGAEDRPVVLSYSVLSTDAPEQAVLLTFAADGPGDDCESVTAATRSVAATTDLPAAALRALLAGPTREEQDRGALPLLGASGDGLLRSVRLADGVARVDLDRRLLQAGQLGTSCAGTAFVTQVEGTLRPFGPLEEVVYAVEGDPAVFYDLLGRSCPDRLRDGDRCSPERFRG